MKAQCTWRPVLRCHSPSPASLFFFNFFFFFFTGEYTIEFALWMHCVQVKEQSSVPGGLPQSPPKEEVTKTKPCRENNMNRSTWIQCSHSNVLYSLVDSPYILNMLFKRNSKFAYWKLFPLRLVIVITATLWSAKNRRQWAGDCEVANIDVDGTRGIFKPASSHKYMLTELKQRRGACFLFFKLLFAGSDRYITSYDGQTEYTLPGSQQI